jgi:hypothetical protein
MCKLLKKTRKKTFTGYKVALKVNGKYYSCWSGMRYTLGPVKGMKRTGKYSSRILSFVMHRDDVCHNPNYFGKTAVLGILEDVLNERILFKTHYVSQDLIIVILEMTISGPIWLTNYKHECYAGTNIISFKEIQL